MVPRAFSFHWNFILMSWKSNGIRTSLMKRDLGPIRLESEYDRQSFPLKLPLDVFLLQGNLRLYFSGFFLPSFYGFYWVLLGFSLGFTVESSESRFEKEKKKTRKNGTKTEPTTKKKIEKKTKGREDETKEERRKRKRRRNGTPNR